MPCPFSGAALVALAISAAPSFVARTPLAALSEESADVSTPTSTPFWSLGLDQALGARLVSYAEAQLAAELAELERELAATSAWLRERPSLTASAGARRGDGSTRPDAELELDLPLLAGPARRARGEALAVLRDAAPVLRAAARSEADLGLRIAFLNAWLASGKAQLRSEQVATVERWLTVSRARVEAGSEAPYQATLVAAELAAAKVEEMAAIADAAATLTSLLSQIDLQRIAGAGSSARGIRGPVLEAPPAPRWPTPAAVAALEDGTLHRALSQRRSLELALLELRASREQGRWGLAPAIGREGEETVARLGLTVSLPFSGERATWSAARQAGAAAVARETEVKLAELAARTAAARAVWARAEDHVGQAGLAQAELEAVSAALTLRLDEGKDNASTLLPLRRQLLAAELLELERRHTVARLAAELAALTDADVAQPIPDDQHVATPTPTRGKDPS